MDEYLSYNILRINDLYLAPICLLVLFIIANIIRQKYAKTAIQRYIMPAITIRFACAILYTLVLVYYYGFGDSYNYYQGVLDMHKAVSDDFSYLGDIYSKVALDKTDRLYTYFRYDGNQTIMVIMNSSEEEKNLDTKRFSERTAGFNTAKNIVSGETHAISDSWKIPGKTIWILELTK